MWFRIRDVSVSDRLRSRCKLNDRVVEPNLLTRDLPFDSPSGVNVLNHAGGITRAFLGPSEQALCAG